MRSVKCYCLSKKKNGGKILRGVEKSRGTDLIICLNTNKLIVAMNVIGEINKTCNGCTAV